NSGVEIYRQQQCEESAPGNSCKTDLNELYREPIAPPSGRVRDQCVEAQPRRVVDRREVKQCVERISVIGNVGAEDPSSSSLQHFSHVASAGGHLPDLQAGDIDVLEKSFSDPRLAGGVVVPGNAGETGLMLAHASTVSRVGTSCSANPSDRL